MANPSVFVGSSEEGLHIARAIGHSLRNDAEVNIWDEGVFAPGQGFLEALVNAVERFDFAILVLTPDDLIESRTLTALAPRDNVMFELGLFMGRLGRSRTFVVASDDKDMKIPSDFAGVTMLTFQSHRNDDNILASVSSACFQIRQAMQSLGSPRREV
jgi:predicted nucleotide-binding protein